MPGIEIAQAYRGTSLFNDVLLHEAVHVVAARIPAEGLLLFCLVIFCSILVSEPIFFEQAATGNSFLSGMNPVISS